MVPPLRHRARGGSTRRASLCLPRPGQESAEMLNRREQSDSNEAGIYDGGVCVGKISHYKKMTFIK